jgi:WD repeat-containing protein mio
MRLEATRHARNNVLSSGPIVSLPVRNSRSCNSLAFCSVDPNYLAVGLDKVRGDSSLIIWDIQTASPSLSISPHLSSNSNYIRPQPHIPRADLGPRADNRILQQHALTEIVSSLSFLPQSTHLLVAGISLRWLRLFDLRSPTPSATNVASKVHGVATDPFDPHRIACFGENTVSVWDARMLSNPLLSFTEKDASADGASRTSRGIVQEIEFSSSRRGVLAVLHKDGSHVRFWDLKQAHGSTIPGLLNTGERSAERSREPSLTSRTPKLSWAHLPWAADTGNQSPMADAHSLNNVILSETRKSTSLAGIPLSY